MSGAEATGTASPSSWNLAWLLGALYAILTLVVIFRTTRYGMQFPYSDDWVLLPQWLGTEPLSLRSLLAHHNEHRIPLERLYWIVVFRLTGGDFRWMAIANTLLLVTAGLVLNAVIAKTRGSLAWSDALVPIALLSFTHSGHLWLFQASFVIPFCGVIVLMSSIVSLTAPASAGTRSRTRVGIVLGLSILALSGGAGVIVAAVVAIYLCLEAWWLTRIAQRPRAPTDRAFLGGLALVILICVAIAATTPTVERGWASPTAGTIAAIALHMLVAPLGTSGLAWWPWTLILPAALLGMYAWYAGRLIMRRAADGALGPLRLGVVMLGMLVLYLTLGISRGGRGEFPMIHYALLGLPLYLCLYVSAELYSGGLMRGLTRAILTVALVGGFVLSLPVAFQWGRARLERELAVQRAILAGESADTIAREHIATLFFEDSSYGRAVVASGLRALKAAGVAPFQCVDARLDASTHALPIFCLARRPDS